MSRLRQTARGIIVRDGKLLMFERWRRDLLGREKHYFSIPGGGIDDGETPEAAVIREMEEEMSVKVEPVRLLFRQETKTRYNYYYLCEITEGIPKFNLDSEEARFGSITGNRYEVAWQPMELAADSVLHDDYRQVLEMLPGLLANSQAKTVDIVLSGE